MRLKEINTFQTIKESLEHNKRRKTVKKSMDYIFGMITGISITIAVLALTNNSLNAYSNDVLEVKVVNPSWNPVKVEIQQ